MIIVLIMQYSMVVVVMLVCASNCWHVQATINNCMYVTMSVYEWPWHHPCRKEVMNVEVLCTHAGNDYNKLACIVSVYGYIVGRAACRK